MTHRPPNTAPGSTTAQNPAGVMPSPADATTATSSRAQELLTTAEVAGQYKLNIGTLRYWRHIGYGPASFALGRKIVYRRADVDAWIADQEHQTRRGGTTT